MKFAFTNAQMRTFEEKITEKTPVSVLMERAGRALAEAVEGAMRRCGTTDAAFVCGGGNNGGDGFTAAEILRQKGYEVTVICLSERFSEACAAAKSAYRGEILGRIPRRRFSVIADCLFGTGLTRPVEGENAALIGFINGGDYVVACDLPSGLSAGGIALGACVRADETVAMGQAKCALYLSDGADRAGKVTVADIGIPAEGGTEIWEREDVAAFFPKRPSHSHKGNFGSVAILATCNMLGAPLLSVGAALKSGAGYTDVYMTSASIPCGDAAKIAAFQAEDEVHRALFAAKYPACRFTFYDGEPIFAEAIAFGMGAGVGRPQYEIIGSLLENDACGTLILDADALNTLSVCGTELLKKHRRPVILTPHPAEFSRLTGRPVGEILSDPVGCAREFAREYGVVVVLKNNRSVITDGTRTAINPTGSPALAKGGSGDVLAGLIAGTAGRGVPPFEAACVGCYLLGRAGEAAARVMGEYAPDATDIISYLAEAISEAEGQPSR